MGAIVSYIQSMDKVQELVNNRIYGKCYNCKKNIILNDTKMYCYKIIGLGKYDQKKICHDCLKSKFIKYLV